MSPANEVETPEGLATPSAVIGGMQAGDEMEVKNVLSPADIAELEAGASPQPSELDAARVVAEAMGQPAPTPQAQPPAPAAPGQGTPEPPPGTPAPPDGTEGKPGAAPAEGGAPVAEEAKPHRISYNRHERLMSEQAATHAQELAELRQAQAELQGLQDLAKANPDLTIAQLVGTAQQAPASAAPPVADPRIANATALAQQNAQWLAMNEVRQYARNADGKELAPDEVQAVLDCAGDMGVPIHPQGLMMVYDHLTSQNRTAEAEARGYERGRAEIHERETRKAGAPGTMNSAGPLIGAPSASPRPPTEGDAVMRVIRDGI